VQQHAPAAGQRPWRVAGDSEVFLGSRLVEEIATGRGGPQQPLYFPASRRGEALLIQPGAEIVGVASLAFQHQIFDQIPLFLAKIRLLARFRTIHIP